MKLRLRIALGTIIIGLAAPAAFAATTYTNTIAQMTAYITSQMDVNNIPGLSIALVDNQTVVWVTGFGNADRENGVVADADTVYHIGSCSKAFLGTAYMQLRDQVRVDIETNLTHYMPEFSILPHSTDYGTVTIRSLLNHHSGLPGDFFNGTFTSQARGDYVEWLIRYLQGDYAFAPVNERNYYCNCGFVLLSDVVLRITGTNFAEATDTMIFRPMGMDASSFLPDKPAIVSRLAASYNTAGERQPPEMVQVLGSGSMYSSANDLTKYMQMILADGQHNGQTLVSSNGIDEMTEPQGTNLPLNVSSDFSGLGWDDVNDYRLRYAGKVFWKDGGTLCHSAFLAISRDLKLGVAVIQNTAGSQCDTIGIQALRWAILDKQGTDWRTNSAYVPPVSPVTNLPQTNLNALAGLYVGSAGYQKVVAESGSLTLMINAYLDTPTIFSNLVPRANGWFSVTNSQNYQFAFTNLADHAMLVMSEVSDGFKVDEPVGEYYLPEALSAAWKSRTNRVYRLVDLYPFDYFWEPNQPETKTLRFTVKDGALFTSWMLGSYVIEPQDDNLAFQRGVHYRKGGAIRVFTTNGFELLQYSSYRFMDEAAIPTLPVNTLTNGTIPFVNGTQWYWFTGQTGTTYRARLMAPNQNYIVRITDREGITCSSGTNNGPATWTCTSNGTYAIAVSATNVFAFTASLTVVGLYQAQNDYDGDGKADPAAYQDGQVTVAFSGCDYELYGAVMGGPGGIECSADFDGDDKTDPAVYNPTTSLLSVLFSARSYAEGGMSMGGDGCVPVVGDFDGDHKADPAIYVATPGLLIAWLSNAGYSNAYAFSASLGGAGWLNAGEDYDGDSKTDPAVFEPTSGRWQVLLSSCRYSPRYCSTAGGAGVVPIAGDYDGDGKADFMVYEPVGGQWLCTFSGQGYTTIGGMTGFGGPMMVPRAGDYDNDGKADMAVYDPVTRTFYVRFSGSGYRLAGIRW